MMKINERLTAITKAHAKDGQYSGTYFQMTKQGFDWLKEALYLDTTPDNPMKQPWMGGVNVNYLTGITVALIEDLPDNMWRLVNVNTGVIIEEGFIEDEPSLPQKQDEGRTEVENP